MNFRWLFILGISACLSVQSQVRNQDSTNAQAKRDTFKLKLKHVLIVGGLAGYAYGLKSINRPDDRRIAFLCSYSPLMSYLYYKEMKKDRKTNFLTIVGGAMGGALGSYGSYKIMKNWHKLKDDSRDLLIPAAYYIAPAVGVVLLPPLGSIAGMYLFSLSKDDDDGWGNVIHPYGGFGDKQIVFGFQSVF